LLLHNLDALAEALRKKFRWRLCLVVVVVLSKCLALLGRHLISLTRFLYQCDFAAVIG